MESNPQKEAPRKTIDHHLLNRIYLIFGTVVLILLTYTTLQTLSLPSLKSILENQAKTLSKLDEVKKDLTALRKEQETNKTTMQEIKKLQEEIAILKKESRKESSIDILGLADIALGRTANSYMASAEATQETGFLTIKDRWKSVDVHLEKNSSSKIIGQALLGKTYGYIKKEGSYYYFALSPSVKGWIHEQFVSETGK